MVDATIHSSFFLVVHITKKRGEANPEQPFLKYSGKNGRMIFQMDLAHSLMEKGLLMDCPPCECGEFFFCKYRIIYGVQHKKPPMFRVPLLGEPESPHVPPSPPTQHPGKALPMKKGWCKVFENRLKERYNNKTVEELRKMKGSDGGKLMGSTSKGCPLCN
jgi:hypothetical protein